MTSRLLMPGLLAFGLLLLAFNTLFIVDQREQVVVVRFGDPARVINASGKSAGLNFKAPFLEQLIRFDRRNIALEADKEEVITSLQERLVVDAFVRYRISEPLQFYRTLRDERIAADRIERLVNSSLRQVLGSATAADIISGRRAQLMPAPSHGRPGRSERTLQRRRSSP